MKRFFWAMFVVCFLAPVSLTAEETGKIEGIVLDEEIETPLTDVTVTLKRTGQRVTTNQDGKFVLEAPFGAHDIIVTYPFYHTRKLSGIQVAKDSPAVPLRIALASKVIELDPLKFAVRLSEVGLLEKRRLSFAVEDNISTELMSKLPVSDAGDALKRG